MTDDTNKAGADKAPKPKRQSSPKRKDTTSKGAQQLLAQMESHKEEVKLEIELDRDFENDWYLECHHCSKPAIFITHNDGTGRVKPNHWFASYKEATQPYYSQRLMCQCCHQQVTAQMNHDGSLTLQARLIRSPQDQAKKQAEADLERSKHASMAKAKFATVDAEVSR